MNVTRETLLARKPLRVVPFSCEAGDLHLLVWTGKERMAWDQFIQNISDQTTGNIANTALWRATLLQLGICDAAGVLVFGPGDVEKLQESDSGWQVVACAAIVRLNKLSAFEVAQELENFPKRAGA